MRKVAVTTAIAACLITACATGQPQPEVVGMDVYQYVPQYTDPKAAQYAYDLYHGGWELRGNHEDCASLAQLLAAQGEHFGNAREGLKQTAIRLKREGAEGSEQYTAGYFASLLYEDWVACVNKFSQEDLKAPPPY